MSTNPEEVTQKTKQPSDKKPQAETLFPLEKLKKLTPDEIQALQFKAKDGDLYAQINLFNCLSSGIFSAPGAEMRGYTQMFEYYQTKSKAGDMNALNFLGRFYADGIGVPACDVSAFTCFAEAANQNHAEAQKNLGMCYELGTGTTIDPAKAFKTYQLSAGNGRISAYFNLARCYEYGIGIAVNLKLAINNYETAIERGYVGTGVTNAKACLDRLISNERFKKLQEECRYIAGREAALTAELARVKAELAKYKHARQPAVAKAVNGHKPLKFSQQFPGNAFKSQKTNVEHVIPKVPLFEKMPKQQETAAINPLMTLAAVTQNAASTSEGQQVKQQGTKRKKL